jgi:hypothetical protein
MRNALAFYYFGIRIPQCRRQMDASWKQVICDLHIEISHFYLQLSSHKINQASYRSQYGIYERSIGRWVP